VNTLIDRTRLTGTTPKTKEFFTLNLDDQQLRFLALWTMLLIPFAAAILGIFILWRRRS
jgi:ABC-type Mn2+/Zn2+ transport system permease subunit